MNETLTNYIKFFKDQIDEMLLEYRRLLRAPMKQLLMSGQVHHATVHGVSKEKGHVVLRLIDKTRALRLKTLRSFVLIKRAARESWGESPYDWDCSFEEFLSKEAFHSASSLAMPLYYLQSNDPKYAFVGCGAISSRMFRKIQGALENGIKIHVILYETEPPIRYLANLIDYVERNQSDGILMSTPAIKYDEWKPRLLAYDSKDQDGIPRTLLKALEQKHKIVLQGPPGTGKSFCAAKVIADYLSKGKSVCVSTLTNKALLELILQPPLANFLKDGKLSKTLLTSDEAIVAKGLNLKIAVEVKGGGSHRKRSEFRHRARLDFAFQTSGSIV